MCKFFSENQVLSNYIPCQIQELPKRKQNMQQLQIWKKNIFSTLKNIRNARPFYRNLKKYEEKWAMV